MRNKSADKYRAVAIREKRPQDWAAEEQLLALQESHGLSGEALQAWCRERGLFPHHLTSWKAAFCIKPKEATSGSRELRTLKDEIVVLKREAVRKDKALAEAAALLILQKSSARSGRTRTDNLPFRARKRASPGKRSRRCRSAAGARLQSR